MSEFLSFGMGEESSVFISFGFGYIEITEGGEVIVHLPQFFYCPRCGANAPLGQRFYAVPNVFYPDTLEVKCATCWDHPTVGEVKRRRK